MNKTLVGIGIVAVIVAIGYVAWDMGRQQPPPAPAPVVEAPEPPPPPVTAAPPAIRYPIETPAPKATPLPALDESDAAFGEALGRLLGLESLPAYVYPDGMIRRFVATVDNLPRRRAPARMMPVAPVAGLFEVTGADSELVIGPGNSARYEMYVGILKSVDVSALMDVYVRFYPLFQQAYQELGYPKGYFNDRLVEAIDNMLTAPEVPAPVRLVQPGVLYQFAEPELEGLSAGRKIMIRMGGDHTRQVKSVLVAIREEVVRRASKD